MNFIKKTLIIVISIFFLYGCNSGNNSNTSTKTKENNNTYNLQTFALQEYSFDFTGTFETLISTSDATMNFVVIKNNPTQITTRSTLNIPDVYDNQEIEKRTTFDLEGREISSVYTFINLSCNLKDELSPLPSEAKVGYSSDTFEYICSDGSSYIQTLELNDAGDSNAEVVITLDRSNGDFEQIKIVINTDNKAIAGSFLYKSEEFSTTLSLETN